MVKSHFEVFDAMLDEIQQLRLDAIYFSRSTLRAEQRIERLRKKRKEYEDQFLHTPTEKYVKKIGRCCRMIKRLLDESCENSRMLENAVSELKCKCEVLCADVEVPFDLDVPSVTSVNCTINVGEMSMDGKLYCKCNRPAFKSMIMCGSHECSNRWFHYECIGISSVPKTEWICSECKKALCKS
ncbi:chromatin remodeling protein [Ordospora colligata]|uniref:Chromatin remodeling protein n=1 Tax=Ordospora colligata OC4 TaxID=1354746 RepID=A0A0B2UKE5_9MICR|nr:chromatin remodeling protein [Ordospora colligata OC4]KHN69694.1 chromatin remodeling protein [Ordospora colligata OC4]TBU15941.1 chromatin remodeling protein [Ordospora colligata]TBU18835.1 chromatin remodeling protein [Ordospora colligata]